jgi:hypothetical protein
MNIACFQLDINKDNRWLTYTSIERISANKYYQHVSKIILFNPLTKGKKIKLKSSKRASPYCEWILWSLEFNNLNMHWERRFQFLIRGYSIHNKWVLLLHSKKVIPKNNTSIIIVKYFVFIVCFYISQHIICCSLWRRGLFIFRCIKNSRVSTRSECCVVVPLIRKCVYTPKQSNSPSLTCLAINQMVRRRGISARVFMK